MKHLVTIGLALTFALQAGAQAITQKKIARINGYSQTTTGENLSTVEKRFYNSNDSLAFSFTYEARNGQLTRSGYKYQFYDHALRHVSDSTNLAKTYYSYDEVGHVVKVVNWTNYNNPKYPDTKRDSTLYFYTADKLDSTKISNNARTMYVYHYNDNGACDHRDTYGINYSDNYKYEIVSRLYYEYDHQGNLVATLNKTIDKGSTEADGGTHNTYAYDDEGKLVADTIVGQWSTVAHSYTYDNDGLLEQCVTYSLNSTDNTWKMTKRETYDYGLYGATRTPTRLSAKQSVSEPTTVELSFDAPTSTNAPDGYKVMTDETITDSVWTTSATRITLLLQTRGNHVYRLVPVYGGLEGNISDTASVNLDFTLPAPQNLRLYSKEYVGVAPYGNWQVQFEWDKPQASPYTLLGYRYEAATSKGNVADSALMAKYVDYSRNGDETTIHLYAVYNVGESEAATISYNTKDHNDQITKHFHNKEAVVRNQRGEAVARQHYLYVPVYDDYNIGESLYATIVETTDGKPRSRVTADGNETRKWNPNQWKWDDWKKTVNLKDVAGRDSVTIDEVYTDGKWNATKKQYVNYTANNTVSYYTEVTFNGTDSTIVRFTRKEERNGTYGSLQAVTDSLYTSDGTLTGQTVRMVKGYDKNNILRYSSITNYTYKDGAMTPTSKRVNTYDTSWNLIKEEWLVSENGEWQVDSVAQYDYSVSKEYSRSHTPEGDFTLDVDNEDNTLVTWPEPVRQDGLTGYVIYLNDVPVDTLEPGTLTYNVMEANIPASALGDHTLRVMAQYNHDENCLSKAVDVSVMSTTGITPLERPSRVKSVEAYDLTGRQLNTSALDAQHGSIVIVRETLNDGMVKTRKVMIK